MRGVYAACLALLLVAATAIAAPPEVPAKVEGKPGKPVLFDVKIDPAKKVGWARGFDKNKCVVVRLHSDDPALMSFMAIPDSTGEFYLTFWTEGEIAHSQTVLSIVGPQPPPTPPEPDPPGPNPPDPPTPAPTGFRVIFVLESGDTLPNGVIFAQEVRDYLNAKCAKEGGHPEWRVRDKDSPPNNESPTIKALWESARPKVTTVPCVIIAVNGKAEIHQVPATAAELVALLRKFGG